MKYIPREAVGKIQQLAGKFPIVSITGPRQSGKSTIAKHAFPSYGYVSLEDPNMRMFALEDPLGFLGTYPGEVIIDEAQRAPELFSYLQSRVDESGLPGQYVLSGSQNFLLSSAISQSLAGRVAVMHLLPLSRYEPNEDGLLPGRLDDWLLTGGYPRIYQQGIDPADFFPSYIETYLERDARAQLANTSLTNFQRFLRLCAGRIGQLLDIGNLSTEAGVDSRTAKRWLSILQASFIVFLVQPYYKNFNKRLVKRPKLFFCDTGLACSLLGLRTAESVALSPFRGGLFENMAFTEYVKRAYAQGRPADVWFWKETATNEVDLVMEEDGSLRAVEVKSGATFDRKWFSSMKVFTELAGVDEQGKAIVYGGEADLKTSRGDVISWRNW